MTMTATTTATGNERDSATRDALLAAAAAAAADAHVGRCARRIAPATTTARSSLLAHRRGLPSSSPACQGVKRWRGPMGKGKR